jgi:hypothetical protein
MKNLQELSQVELVTIEGGCAICKAIGAAVRSLLEGMF